MKRKKEEEEEEEEEEMRTYHITSLLFCVGVGSASQPNVVVGASTFKHWITMSVAHAGSGT
jgi:hypothetical protein